MQFETALSSVSLPTVGAEVSALLRGASLLSPVRCFSAESARGPLLTTGASFGCHIRKSLLISVPSGASFDEL